MIVEGWKHTANFIRVNDMIDARILPFLTDTCRPYVAEKQSLQSEDQQCAQDIQQFVQQQKKIDFSYFLQKKVSLFVP